MSSAVLVMSCAFVDAEMGRKLDFEAVPDIPADWGRHATDRVDLHGCPLIAGDYEMTADIVSVEGGAVRTSRSDAFAYFSLFIGPLGGVSREAATEDPSRTMTIGTLPDGSLVLDALAPDYVRRISYAFPGSAGGAWCDAGFYRPPDRQDTGIVEGGTINVQSRIQFTSLEDGSLVYYEQFGPLRSIVGDGRGFTHRYYRFRPAAPSAVDD